MTRPQAENQLRNLYSFNAGALKDQFTSKSSEINRSNMLVIKQLCFLQFREAVAGTVSVPPELFSYEAGVLKMPESQAIKTAMDEKSKLGDGDLTSLLERAYPGVPWITDYFILSTFPSIFGHFVCDEFAHSACNFLQNHMSDPLIAKLVGGFLFHNLLFRDRLHDQFFDLLRGDSSDDLFFHAFSGAVPYFSKWQIQAFLELRRQNENAAISALFDYCLVEIVRLWQYSPIFGPLNLIFRTSARSPSVNTYGDVISNSLLLDYLRDAKLHLDFARPFLDVFEQTTSTSDLPNAASIFFYGGVFLPLTVVDLIISQNMSASRPPPGSVDSALEDAFRVRLRASYFPASTLEFPKPTETGDEITEKKLEECREMHNFLHHIAGGLKWFELVGRTARSLLPLHCQSLVDRLLALDPKLSVRQFTLLQEVRFAVRQFFTYARQPVIEQIRKSFPNVNKYIEDELGRRIAGRRSGEVAEALYLIAGELVTEWKQKAGQPGGISPPGRDLEVPICQYFLKSGKALAKGFLRQRASRIHWGIVNPGLPPEQQREERKGTVEHFLKFNGSEVPMSTDVERDAMARQILEQSRPAWFLLTTAEETFRNQFDAEVDSFRVGGVLDLVVEIHDQLVPLLQSEAYADDVPSQRGLLWLIVERNELPFVKWNILRVIALVEAVEMNAVEELTDFCKFAGEALAKLKRKLDALRRWFGFRDGRLKLPPLGQI